jgi:hypothetical protein
LKSVQELVERGLPLRLLKGCRMQEFAALPYTLHFFHTESSVICTTRVSFSLKSKLLSVHVIVNQLSEKAISFPSTIVMNIKKRNKVNGARK